MKNIFLTAVLSVILSGCCSNVSDERVVVAYVTSWSSVVPDPCVMTHLNYAFGHVNDDFDGVRVDNPERLHQMVALKSVNPDLKVLLSVGGWGSGRFSEMAADDACRASFAEDCLRVVEEFGLDGICLHPWCHAETERHKLTVTPTYARVDYPSFAGPEKGLDFYFDQLCVAPDGRMFVPCGTWRWKEGNWQNDEKD